MCRLFGALSVKAINAWKYIFDDPCSLYVQSNVDPRRLQSDGWGVGFYLHGASSCLFKSEKSVYAERERFASIIRAVDSRIILMHIRRASNPKELSREKIISIENSQPFNYGNYMFAHNGVVNIPDEVAERLGEWRQQIKSSNDSEVYFWYLMKELAEETSFPEALKNFENMLSDLWWKNRERHPDKNCPYLGLNTLFSNGERLYAYCKYDETADTSRSLCFKDQPAFQMSYLMDPTSLVVASEKTNCDEKWHILKSGQLLTGEIVEGKIRISLEEI